MNFLKKIFFVLFLFFFQFAQSQDADVLISKMRVKFNAIQSYSANARIRADISFLKILPVNATIYFKQKDKFRIKAKGLAILPKQGTNIMMQLLNDDKAYQKLSVAKQVVKNKECQVIKLIPIQDTGDILLGTLYIEEKSLTILRAIITTKSMGTVQADFSYGTYAQYLLPDSVVFTMDVKKFKIPRAIAGDLENAGKKKAANANSKIAQITIRYKDYKLNVPIDDKVFMK